MKCENCAGEIIVNSYRQPAQACNEDEVNKKVEEISLIDRIKFFLLRRPVLVGLFILSNLPVAIFLYIKLCLFSLEAHYSVNLYSSSYIGVYILIMIGGSIMGAIVVAALNDVLFPDNQLHSKVDKWIFYRITILMIFWAPVCGVLFCAIVIVYTVIYGSSILYKTLHKFLTSSPEL